MSTDNLIITAVFVLYLAFMLGIGVFFFRRTENIADYFLGDRKLNKWVAALSAQASDMSGWLLLGLPGAAYLAGLSSSWIAVGLLAGTYLNWRFVARRLRRFTALSPDIITLSDYLEYRFKDHARILRAVSALLILVFFLIYTSSGFVAGGKLFSTVFGLPYTAALLAGAAVVISYTFLGGFNAVCWTDFIQGTLMLFAIVIVPVGGLAAVGGMGPFATAVKAVEPEFFYLFQSDQDAGGLTQSIVLVSSLAWGLGYFGQPHILVRFMAIEADDQIPGARRIAMGWVTIALAMAVLVGMVGRAYISPALEGGDSEKVFIMMVEQMFPAVVAGVLLAAILAAIMSTADSQLLVTTSAITEDFYKAFIRPAAQQNELVWVSRTTAVGVAVVATCLAFNPDSSVLELVGYAWAGFGAAFGPTILMSLYWRKMTRNGALAGMLVGGTTVLVWKQMQGGIFELYEIVPGCLLSFLAIGLFSALGRSPDEKTIEDFEALG